MKPLVSIIVPNYNHAIFLAQRLESIYSQTFSSFEVIILDDASTDNSIEVLNLYKTHPKTAHLIVNTQNSGSPFKQWKKGIELAKGELIWIAESDDYAATNFLEQVVQPLLTNKEIGLTYCQSMVVDENNQALYINTKWTDDIDKNRWLKSYNNNGVDECIDYLLYKNTIPNASAVVFRKSLATKFPTTFKMAGDWWFWVSILQKTTLSYHHEPLNFFRTHAKTTRSVGNLSKKKLRLVEEVKVILLIKKYLSKYIFLNRLEKVYKVYLHILPLKLLLLNNINPFQFKDASINYSKIVSLTIKEIITRIYKK